MGCSGSKEQEQREKKASDRIDAQLEADKKKASKEVKLLLLGAGESAKSTILKQMKILHQGGFTKDECLSYREIVWSNTIQSMQVLLKGMKIVSPPVSFDDAELDKKAEEILNLALHGEGLVFTPQIAETIKNFWAMQVIQHVYERSSILQLDDSAKYFFDNIDRLAETSYLPTEQDVLRSRIKTTGILEASFQIQGTNFRIFDVGGQRSERRKWIHCFEGVTAVIFCVALAEYDLVLREDETQNRLEEALQLFDSICNSQYFTESTMFLFLNETDLFREKIVRVPLSNFFPDYDGGDDFDKGTKYLKDKFLALNKFPEKKTIHTHLTCATDTENIRSVWQAVSGTIMGGSSSAKA